MDISCMIYVFISAYNSASVTAFAYGEIMGQEIKWPIGQPDACLNSGLTCPLKNGNTYRYSITFPVSHSYPSVRKYIHCM